MEPRDPLSSLLQTWRHDPPADPDFDAEVWDRIKAGAGRNGAAGFYRWALPLAASIALLLGAGSAWLESRQQYTARMAATYVQSVDPLQMTAHAHQP